MKPWTDQELVIDFPGIEATAVTEITALLKKENKREAAPFLCKRFPSEEFTRDADGLFHLCLTKEETDALDSGFLYLDFRPVVCDRVVETAVVALPVNETLFQKGGAE